MYNGEKKMKRIISIMLCVLLTLSSVGVLTSCAKEDDANTFTILIVKNEDAVYYSDYSQNPVVLWTTTQKEYLGEKINIEWKGLVSGSEKDQFNTMISTGEYYNFMPLSYTSYSASALYEMGIALDLTEYVEEYMPNYKHFIDTNEEANKVAYTLDENGNKRILQLWSAAVEPSDNFEGHIYRRDWIVKYGVNPSTGEPFTGGYTAKLEDGSYDALSWSDDVVFPSWYSDSKYVTEYKERHPDWDGTDPIFISDWEWMFEIFDKAMEDLGIKDGYNFSMYYVGFNACGDFYSGFGGTAPMWYYNTESGHVEFDMTSEHMQAYLECLNSWYEKGWFDKEFDTRTSDIFYAIDTAAVRQGKVGMWQGRRSDLNNQIDDPDVDDPITDGIYAIGAKQPINDVYGTEECKGKDPISSYQFDVIETSHIVTVGTEEKNIGVLLTYLDSFFDPESENALAKNLGLTKEQFEAIRPYQEEQKGQAVQERYGIEDGTWYELPEGSKYKYAKCDTLKDDVNLNNAIIGNRIYGLALGAYIETLSDDIYDTVVNKWFYYDNSAFLPQYLQKLMNADDANTFTRIQNNLNTKASTEIPKFIKGEYDIYGADWDTYCKTINKMNHEKATAIYDKTVGN